jgi:hypothetical protein
MDSDSEDEECRITSPTRRDLEKPYFLPPPTLEKTETEMETDILIKEEEGEALPEEEGEPINQEEGQDDVWITNKIRKNVEKCIPVLEKKQSNSQTQAKDLINIDVVRLNLLSMIHPFITECQKLIKRLPRGLIKRTYPNGNEKQVINYCWSGDINTGPDVPNFISLADHPYLPTLTFGNQNPVNQPQPLNNQPVEVNEDLFEDEDGFQTLPNSPQPATLRTSRRGS